MKQFKLLKDLVIPAGTIFTPAAAKVERSEGNYEHILGISKDTSGSVVYYIGNPGEPEYEQTREWFEEVKE